MFVQLKVRLNIHIIQNRNHPLYYFSILWKIKWIQSLDIITRGPEQGSGSDREAIGEGPYSHRG